MLEIEHIRTEAVDLVAEAYFVCDGHGLVAPPRVLGRGGQVDQLVGSRSVVPHRGEHTQELDRVIDDSWRFLVQDEREVSAHELVFGELGFELHRFGISGQRQDTALRAGLRVSENHLRIWRLANFFQMTHQIRNRCLGPALRKHRRRSLSLGPVRRRANGQERALGKIVRSLAAKREGRDGNQRKDDERTRDDALHGLLLAALPNAR